MGFCGTTSPFEMEDWLVVETAGEACAMVSGKSRFFWKWLGLDVVTGITPMMVRM
jgi:hypothetical protein